MTFNNEYNTICKPVEEDINSVREKISKLYEEVTGIDADIKDFLTAPAKHIRAVMSFLYLKALGIKINKKQIAYQAIIELIHNASLIHDDVIDKAEIRRLKPSLNQKEGNHIAVIGGDLVLSMALKEIAKLNNPKILDDLADTFSQMCYGEIKQYSNRYKIPTLEEYTEKTYLKTGVLFEKALTGALTLAGYNHKENAETFAKYFGIAFQMNNDIKNILGNPQNNDIQSGIYTAAVIFSGNPDTPLSGIEKAKSLLNNYVSNAKIVIEQLDESLYKNALLKLSELIKI